jgi:hypothetical protein
VESKRGKANEEDEEERRRKRGKRIMKNENALRAST